MRHLTITESPSLLAVTSPPGSLKTPTVPGPMKEAQKALSLILAGGTSRCETPPEAGAAPLPLTDALWRLSEGEEVWLRISYPEGPCRKRTMILSSLEDAENLLAS